MIKRRANIPSEAHHTPHNKATVLLVGCDSIFKQAATRLVQGNVLVRTAGGMTDALEQLSDGQQWDLLVISQRLLDGVPEELCRAIRRRYTLNQLPILVITDFALEQGAQSLLEAGANDVVLWSVEEDIFIARIHTLVQLKKNSEMKLQSDMAFLQAQIKPHFMLNTLTSIAALSEKDPEQMRLLLSEFSEFIQRSYSFSNLQQLIDVQSEMALVESYLYIELLRHDQHLSVSYQIERDLEGVIPPLIIQPLVENAVNHGILPKGAPGQLQLRVYLEAGEIVVVVKDDGVGMDEGQLSRIESGDASHCQAGKGVGITNIQQRLHYLFNRSLSIHSEKGKGTIVQLRIPQPNAILKEKQDERDQLP